MLIRIRQARCFKVRGAEDEGVTLCMHPIEPMEES